MWCSQLLAVVYGDLIRDAEATNNVLPEKLLQGSGGDVSERLGFDPFQNIPLVLQRTCFLVLWAEA